MSTHKAWFAKRRAAWRRDGLCGECGKRPSVFYRCHVCTRKAAERYRARKAAA